MSSNFRVIQNPKGFASIASNRTNELMHSGCDPLPQAESLYIKQTYLEERLTTSKKPIIIWDVGLGAGVNATAAVNLARKIKKEIKIISFEIDLDSLLLVQSNLSRFPNCGIEAIQSIINNKVWFEDYIKWELLLGDFIQTAKDAPKPDVIFWDPFSLKTDSSMWLGSTLEILTQYGFSDNVILSTYSSATRFRAALLSLGWWVGKGAPVSERAESTVAGGESIFKNYSIQPLGKEWVEKFKISSAKFPSDWNVSEDRVCNHKQFA